MEPQAPRPKRSRCRWALGLALLFDALGLAGLLVGGLLETEVADLLIYLGGVAVFFSLPWWVFWHVGNLEVPAEELRDDVGLGWRSGDAWSLDSWRARRLARLARALSARFSLPSTAGSAQSRADGRPHRAHFADSASSLSRPSQLGRQPPPPPPPPLQSSSRIQDSSSESGRGFSTPPSSLPGLVPLSGANTDTTIGLQDSLGSIHFQDEATQVSSRSLAATKWSK